MSWIRAKPGCPLGRGGATTIGSSFAWTQRHYVEPGELRRRTGVDGPPLRAEAAVSHRRPSSGHENLGLKAPSGPARTVG
jgi:hypothetical protein